jgi:hypothetical protein
MQLSPFPCHLVPLRSKCSLHTASYLRGVNETGIWCWCLFLFSSWYFADNSVTPFTIMTGFELEERCSLPFGRNIYFLPHNFDSGSKGNVTLCSKETREIYFDSIFKENLALCLTLSDPTSDLVRQFEFSVVLRCRKTSDTVFVALFTHCWSLSDAFSHVVRTLANREGRLYSFCFSMIFSFKNVG